MSLSKVVFGEETGQGRDRVRAHFQQGSIDGGSRPQVGDCSEVFWCLIFLLDRESLDVWAVCQRQAVTPSKQSRAAGRQSRQTD